MRLTTVNANAYGRNLSHSERSIGNSGYRARIEEAIKSDPKIFFGYVDLKKKRVGYPSVMHFEVMHSSGPEKICDLFAEFIQRTYTNEV
jgi:hypothetical protein